MNRSLSRQQIVVAVGVVILLAMLAAGGRADPGTEGASFLDIPVGGRPAAMGGAYGALAADAYAPVWNPAGLGFLTSTQFSAMHLAYLDSLSYEYVSLVDRLAEGRSLGAAVQFFHTGAVQGTDANGNLTAPFTSYYGAYSLAYGQALSDLVSLGATAKLVTARLDSASAQAWAMDAGTMIRPADRWSLAAGLANLGSKLTFGGQGDSLPSALRAAAAYEPDPAWVFALEGDFAVKSTWKQGGPPGLRGGVEWRLYDALAVRAGYRTDTARQLSPWAGATIGMGLRLWGQDFDYAWVPMGDLGDTHYFSMVLKFGASPPEEGTAKAGEPFDFWEAKK